MNKESQLFDEHNTSHEVVPAYELPYRQSSIIIDRKGPVK